ncbi:MAG: aminobenzoyl-glutamate utilization protein [Bacteroidota bacterium]|nr:aminobenzoyl-glutamate utilization protein [Bacteroidota bacterium]
MKTQGRSGNAALTIILVFLSTSVVLSQKNNKNGFSGKADLYKAKKSALEYLSDSSIVEKYGNISDLIWNYAELGMQEFKSSALLIKALEEEGFKVEKGIAGMPTCFIATWGNGKPVIGILGEFDALPMLSQKPLTSVKDPLIPGAPGHGCGHNMMGTAGIAAAIAVKKSMETDDIPGTIKFFGSPAEEITISRPYMVNAGVFKDVDAVIDNHASTNLSTRYGISGNALVSVVYSFSGKTAHAGSDPWNGRSALDAVEVMNVAVNFLREHIYYTSRIHYVITEGGGAPNVVPDKASVWYYIRNTDDNLEGTFSRVTDCARGAAIATGTKLDTVMVITAIHQKHSSKGMAEILQKNIELVGLPEWTENEQIFAKSLQRSLGVEEKGFPSELNILKEPTAVQTDGASTDVGDVSLVTPVATLNFPGGVPGISGHHWSTVTCGFGPAAWKGLNAGAKVMAATMLDLLTKPELLGAIRNEFFEYSGKHQFKSFLPEGAKPPIDMNREMMDKYRNAMMNNIPDE